MQHWLRLKVGNLFRNLALSKTFSVGISILLILLILGLVVSPFAPIDPARWGKVPRDRSPSLQYPFGTTSTGQDMFWVTTYVIRNALILGAITGGFSIVIALMMGFLAGYLGERFWGKRVNEIINSFSIIPGLPFLLVVAFTFRDYLNMVVIGLLLSTIGWAWPAKALRSIILQVRQRTHVHTAEASGLSLPKIFLRECLPYMRAWAATQFLNLVTWAIGMETILGVFGMSSMEQVTIGTTLYWAMSYLALLRGTWWWLAAPAIVVVLLITSLYYVSMGFSELLNPKSRLAQMKRSVWMQ